MPSPDFIALSVLSISSSVSNESRLSTDHMTIVHLLRIAAMSIATSAASVPRPLKGPHFVRRIEYDELPSLIKGISVLMIRYNVDARSESLSPLKLKEYLATGKPIISTPIAATDRFADDLVLARTADHWRESILRLLDGDGQKRNGRMKRRSGDATLWQPRHLNISAVLIGIIGPVFWLLFLSSRER